MKVALTFDQLINKEHATEVFEEVLSLYKDAQIWVIVHKIGAVDGLCEMRPIRSSFLSNIVRDRSSLGRWSFLVPTAAKSLSIPCHFDLVISVSTGFSHGITKCKSTKRLTYLYDFFSHQQHSFVEKMFGGYLKKWSLDELGKSDKILLSSHFLKQKTGFDEEVVYPSFKQDDYIPIKSSAWKHDFFIIGADGLGLKEGVFIRDFFNQRKQKFFILGKLPKGLDIPPGRHQESMCARELVPLIASSRGYIHFGRELFPHGALKNLSVGRPLLIRESPLNRELLGDAVGVSFFDQDNLVELMDSIPVNIAHEKIRKTTNRFHPLGFKGKLKRVLQELHA
jgi:hypothetical protein